MNKPEQTVDAAESMRHEAINRYLRGERPTTIVRTLGRSRSWFYKVLARYRQAGRDGLRTQSRAPHRVHNRTSEEVEAVIVRIRKTIEGGDDPELRYANLGAESIASEVRRLELTPPHAVTIYRILKRHGLVQPRQRNEREPRLPEDYPYPLAVEPNAVHQADFVRRTLTGGQRFYGAHLLDLARSWPFLRVTMFRRRKSFITSLYFSSYSPLKKRSTVSLNQMVPIRCLKKFSSFIFLCISMVYMVIFLRMSAPVFSL